MATPPVSTLSTSSGPQLVVRIGPREAAVALGATLLLLGGWHAREWNKRRLLAAEERRKARAKEWAKLKQKARDAAYYTAALAGIGLVSFTYFKAQAMWQARSSQPRALGQVNDAVL